MMRRLILLAFVLLPVPAVAAAQDVTIAVRVVDSTNAPVADADVAIVREVSTSLARTTTTRAGRARLQIAHVDGPLQLIVRKIGFQPGFKFFTLTAQDSV